MPYLFKPLNHLTKQLVDNHAIHNTALFTDISGVILELPVIEVPQPGSAKELNDRCVEAASTEALGVHAEMVIGTISVAPDVPHDTNNAIPLGRLDDTKEDGSVFEGPTDVVHASLQTYIATSSVDSTDHLITNQGVDIQADKVDGLARPTLWGSVEPVVEESATAVEECGESVGSAELHLELSDDDMSSEEPVSGAQSLSAEKSGTVRSVISSVTIAAKSATYMSDSEIHLSKSSEASNIAVTCSSVIADFTAEKEKQPLVSPVMLEESTAPLRNRSTSQSESPSKPALRNSAVAYILLV